MTARLDTLLVHAGALHPRPEGAVVTPIFRSANYEAGEEGAADEVRYVRYSNTPNHRVLGARLAAAEGGEAGLVTASGMAAISATLMSALSAGDHLLCQSGVYGGTTSLMLRHLPRWGIEVTFVDLDAPETWAAALRPRTRMFYAESVSNPHMRVGALDKVVSFCQAQGLTSVIDNTFLSPALFQPLPFGFDVVVHSATKLLNGHSDLSAGAIIADAARVEAARRTLNHLGGSLDPDACGMLERGLKTLTLRAQRQSASALTLAHRLRVHPKVRRVFTPGLPDDPGYDRASAWFRGAGPCLSVELRDLPTAMGLVGGVKVFTHAASLGGVESLIVRPARSTHAHFTPEERAALGVTDTLARLSVGVEDVEDLWDDLAAALG
ncbi:PLP-dependent aspartate aminotransferase family protein [Myxococcota bacterium]|nr:PLP-dependent aspartate aminotransferase family protein [Myxococcota bacterium]